MVKVKNHKCSAGGAARIILTFEQEALIDLYMQKVRPNLVAKAGYEKLAVLSKIGLPVAHVSRLIKNVMSKHSYSTVTLTDIRKAVETKSFETLQATEQAHVSSLLNHTPEVAKRHYTALTSKKAAEWQKTLGALLK